MLAYTNYIKKHYAKGKLFLLLLLLILSAYIIYTYTKKPSEKQTLAPTLQASYINPQTHPERFYIKKDEIKKIIWQTTNKQDEKEYLPYYHYKENNTDIVLFKSKNGIQKYEFASNTLQVKLSEKKDNEDTFILQAIAEPIYQYQKENEWIAYPKTTEVKNKTTKETKKLILTQTADNREIEWIFGVEQKILLKNTFRLKNTTNKNRLVWQIQFPKKETITTTTQNLTIKDTEIPVKKLMLGDVEINWEDFNDEKTRTELNKDEQSATIYFYEHGKQGELEIDPTFTMTTSGNYIQLYDGTRWWCFGPGQQSGTTQRFWQPTKIFHTLSGAPTNCTTGGDNQLPGDGTGTGAYDGFIDGEQSVPDDGATTITLLETTPTRAVIQTARNTAADSYAYYTVYPTGTAFMEHRVGTATFATTNGIFFHHDTAAAPQIANRDASTGAIVIADTTNNNYAGAHVIPFSPTTSIPGNLSFLDGSSSDDYYGWYGARIDDHAQMSMVLDYAEYRATTTTRSILHNNFQTPDDIRDGLTNAIIWDKSGEQSWLMHTSFEGGDTNLCDGGDGFQTGECGGTSPGTAIGNDPESAFLGTYGARFTQGTSTDSTAFARFNFTTPQTNDSIAVKFMMKINAENLSDGNMFTVATTTDNIATNWNNVAIRQQSESLYVCASNGLYTVFSCGTTPLSLDTWYHVAFVTTNDTNATGTPRTAVYLNGILQGVITTPGVFGSLRIGIPFSQTSQNSVSIDNVSINYRDTDGHVLGFSPMDGAYTIEAQNWPQKISIDIDRENYIASNTALLVRKWQQINDPAIVTLENTVLTNGVDYNADLLPIAEAWLFDSDGSGFLRLAKGGDTQDTDEYLADPQDNRNFGDTVFRWGDAATDYLYFGRNDRFSGLNISLATPGSGSAQVTWQYCSQNTDYATACDTWSTLTIHQSTQGVANFTTSGSLTYHVPRDWVPSTENNGAQGLYFIRAFVQSGAYTTYPVERLIKSDILALQHIGNITKNDQTFTLQPQAKIADWNIDEGTGDPNDKEVYKKTLTRSGATWRKNNKETNRETYLEFDGINDYLTRAYDQDFDFDAESFSVTGWFRHPTTITGTDTIIARTSSVNGVGWKIYMNSAGNICFGIDDTAGSFPSDAACSSATYTDSTWHHFTAIKENNTRITLYIDGKQAGQDNTLASTNTLDANQALYVGIDADGTSNPWAGDLDKITIYSYALTQEEIYADIPDPTGALFGSNPTDPLLNGLIAWWKMDETTGNAQDSSGNGYTLTNNNTTPFTGGKFANSAGPFNGTSRADPFEGTNRYFSTATTIPNIHTVALWVYPTSTTNHYFNLASGIYLTSSAGTLTAVGFTNPTIYVNGIPHTTIAANRWQHITVTTTSPITANNVEIGRANGAYFQNNGFIDEVRFYDRTLTAPEVEKLYDWGPPPVAYWKLDENTGTTAADNSGNGNTSSTFTGNTAWAVGKYGSGLFFDGDNDVVRIPESSTTDIGAAADSYTVSAWIKTSRDGTSNVGIFLKDDGTGPYPFSLYLNSSEQPCFRISDGTNSPLVCGTMSLNDNNWHHITGVRDIRADAIYIYVNGILVGWGTDTTTGTLANNDDISIGNGGVSYISADFTGVIDDAKIYNYARTQKQIIEDMNAGHPAVGTPVGGAVGHWSLDEATGTTANDKSGNANNLTLSTASWTQTGKFGSAWNGTGANWLFRADDDDFDFIFSESFTLTGWFRSDSPTNPPTDEYILSKEDASRGYALWFNTNGEVICGIDDDATSFPEDAVGDIPQNPDFYDGAWHHYACVRDIAARRLILYIDGKIVDIDTSLSAIGSLTNADTLTFGSRNTTDDTDDFNGDLDELKIYRAALSASEILIDMHQGKTALLGATGTASDGTTASHAASREYCIPGDTTACTPPVGHWSFDENTGTSAYDKSGNNHTGTLQNGPLWARGKIGNAVEFDGTNDRIDVASTSTIDDLQELTITAWIYPRSFGEGNFGRVINKDNGTNVQLLFNMLNNTGQNSIRFYRGRNTTDTYLDAVNNSITVNTWQHIGAVFSTSQSIGRLYINGREVAYALQQIGSGTLNSDAGLTLNIGGRTSGDRTFDGILDDIKLYNYARTHAQINWDYNRGSPLAHYKMDECATTTIYNAALNANGQAAGMDGTWSGSGGTNTTAGTCTTADTTTARYNGRNGKFGSSLDFDATDDIVTITNTSEIDLNEGLRNGFTIAAWIYPDSDGEGHAGRIFDKGTNTYCRLGGETGGRANVICRLDLATDAEYTATTTIPIGQWSHIALAWTNDSDDEITIWVNGTPNTSVGMFAGDPAPDTSNFFIGNNSAGSATFDGRIDDVRIYTYELTGTLIRNLMNEGSAVRFGPITGSP